MNVIGHGEAQHSRFEIIDTQIQVGSVSDPVRGTLAIDPNQLIAHLDRVETAGPSHGRVTQAVVSRWAADTIYDRSVESHHRPVLEFVRHGQGRFVGAMTVNPLLDLEETLSVLNSLVDQGFAAVKLDPTVHGYFPQSCPELLDPILDAAGNLRVPVIIRTGDPAFGFPLHLVEVAARHPSTNLVCANFGSRQVNYSREAIDAARRAPNLYLQTSWAVAPRLREAFSQLGPNRLLFGSDFPTLDIASQIESVRSLRLEPPFGSDASAQDLALIFSDNARRLMGLRDQH